MTITLKFNVLGYLIQAEQINQLLDPQDETVDYLREWMCSFFGLTSMSLYKELLEKHRGSGLEV
jgi:hypothetical protein